MARYRKVSRLVPSAQRSTSITAISAGDQIDVSSILGRPARGIKFIPGYADDVIEVRLNNRRKLQVPYRNTGAQGLTSDFASAFADPSSEVEIVSAGAHYPTYTMTGSESYYSEDGLAVDYIDIVDLTAGGSPVIALQIEVW
jgi:hypothetical protein